MVGLVASTDDSLDGILVPRAQVLKPEQVARAMVHAYPWLPDIMAVAAVVAAEEGDPEALGHLRADSSGGPGAFVQSCGPHPGSGVRRSLAAPLAAEHDSALGALWQMLIASCLGAGGPACRESLCTAGLWPCVQCKSLSQAAASAVQSSPVSCQLLAGCSGSDVPVSNATPCAAAEPQPPQFEGVAMKPARSAEKRLLVATPFAAQSPPAERAPIITSGVM